MASLHFFAWVIFCFFLSAVVGQTPLEPGDGNLDVAGGYVWADVLTDGITRITFGDITSHTLSLTRSLSAGQTTLQNLEVTSVSVADLFAWSLTSDSLTTGSVTATKPVPIEGDTTISGKFSANDTFLGATRATSLMVEGTANFGGAVFAQADAQVKGDLNAGGSFRAFGPATADLSVKIEDLLTVSGSASTASNWRVKDLTESLNVTADVVDTRYLWAEKLDVSGDINVVKDVHAGSLTVGKQTNAKSLQTTQTVTVGKNTTVSGWLFGQTATVTSNANLLGWETVHGSLTVRGDASTASNFTTNGTLSATGNITGGASVLGVDAVFTNLQVDTSSIETLTATFVTATTLQAQDATAKNTFVVTGATTLDTLNVVGASTLNDVNLVSLDTDELSSQQTTSGSLNSTQSATLTTVEVKTLLSAGTPSTTSGFHASFENAFSDDLNAVNFFGHNATIASLSGSSLNYHNVSGWNATLVDFMSTNASVGVVDITDADIITLVGDWANFTHINATTVQTMNVTATMADVMDLWSVNITTESLQTPIGNIDSTSAGKIQTQTFQATLGMFTELRSADATVVTLTATNATITDLNSADATTTSLWAKNLTYNTGVIDNIVSSQHMGNSARLNGFDTTNLYAHTYANLTDTTASTLTVTESSWMSQNASVKTDLLVEGFSSLDSGIIAGDSVIATLTVVGDTLTTSASVTGLAFLTDLEVKKMTITDSFDSATSQITNATLETLLITSNLTVGGTFRVTGDTRLGGNLVVSGTTQFQTGSFSRIGTAVLTTTDMEAFNINVASGLFGALTLDELTVRRTANFQRSIELVGMLSSSSGNPYSWFSSIRPTTLTGVIDGSPVVIDAATVLHTGQSSIDALVFTSSTDPTLATLRVTGDGLLDFMGGSLNFEEIDIANGIVFENENNVAWARSTAVPSTNLARGATAPIYVYSDLIDRDLVSPGQAYEPTRFSQPSNTMDLITLQPGHYRVSGAVYFVFDSAASANSRVIARAGARAYVGTSSSGTAVWDTDCAANFQSVSGSAFGGSCFFDDVLVVDAGEVLTLRSFAEWSFSSLTLANTLRVDPSSTILIEEYFERTSQGL